MKKNKLYMAKERKKATIICNELLVWISWCQTLLSYAAKVRSPSSALNFYLAPESKGLVKKNKGGGVVGRSISQFDGYETHGQLLPFDTKLIGPTLNEGWKLLDPPLALSYTFSFIAKFALWHMTVTVPPTLWK